MKTPMQFIEELDFDLMFIEDIAKGETGNRITALRGKIRDFLSALPEKSDMENVYITTTGALISEHDYNHLSDDLKSQCKIYNQ